jgi:PKD repeat protein
MGEKMLRQSLSLSGAYIPGRFIGGLVCVLLSLMLAACNDSETPEELGVVVTPSSTEGPAPFNVSFDVSSTTSVSWVSWDFGDGTRTETVGDSSVSHTFTEPGEHIVVVHVHTSKTSITANRVTINVNVLADEGAPPPGGGGDSTQDINLVVASFAIDSELTPGTFETVSAIVQNVGTDAIQGSGLINVGYYLSTDDVITVDDILIGDTSIAIGDFFQAEEIPFGVEVLAPGENYQFDHPLALTNNVPAGTYYAGALVDYIDYYDWYTFTRSTDTSEFQYPTNVVVPETDEADNSRVLAQQVTVTGLACIDDAFEPDSSSVDATVIVPGEMQARNFCHDNADWLQFDAVQGNVYKIATEVIGAEADTQLMLYDRDATSILLFNDNVLNAPFITLCGQIYTADLECGWPPNPRSEIVWEALASGTYFIRVRLANCDEDEDAYCSDSPDGAGLDTEYTISLQ